jgi:hypothetical protein
MIVSSNLVLPFVITSSTNNEYIYGEASEMTVAKTEIIPKITIRFIGIAVLSIEFFPTRFLSIINLALSQNEWVGGVSLPRRR